MAYLTLDEFIDDLGEVKLAEVSSRNGTDAMDSGVIERALAEASAFVDGYLAGRYTLPLKSVPLQVKAWTRAVALHALYPNGPTEAVRTGFEDTISQMRDRSVTLTLPQVGAELAPGSSGRVRGHSAPLVFSAEALRGFR